MTSVTNFINKIIESSIPMKSATEIINNYFDNIQEPAKEINPLLNPEQFINAKPKQEQQDLFSAKDNRHYKICTGCFICDDDLKLAMSKMTDESIMYVIKSGLVILRLRKEINP